MISPMPLRRKGKYDETMWLNGPLCDEIVIYSWQAGLNKDGGSTFVNCLDSCTK